MIQADSAPAATAAAKSPRSRLIFANQLRGLAALAVALNHLVGVFWSGQSNVGSATMTPPQGGSVPALYFILIVGHVNLGPLGVAIFFLISGLVIPISLEQHSRLTFVAARLLRIYPTYWAAFAVELFVLWLNSKYWHLPFAYGWRAIWANALLAYNFMFEGDIDLVSWSLVVELKFYVVMALVSASILRGNAGTVFAIGASVLAVVLLVGSPVYAPVDGIAPWISNVVGAEAPYIIFMLIGVLFNFNLRGLLSNVGLGVGIVGMLILFLICWFSDNFTNEASLFIPLQYIYAIVIFGTLFILRQRVRRIKILDYMADISFPFYLIHSLVGYSLLKLLMISGHVPYYLALLITLVGVAAIATALHVSVERWSTNAGKRLARVRTPSTDDRLGSLHPSP